MNALFSQPSSTSFFVSAVMLVGIITGRPISPGASRSAGASITLRAGIRNNCRRLNRDSHPSCSLFRAELNCTQSFKGHSNCDVYTHIEIQFGNNLQKGHKRKRAQFSLSGHIKHWQHFLNLSACRLPSADNNSVVAIPVLLPLLCHTTRATPSMVSFQMTILLDSCT